MKLTEEQQQFAITKNKDLLVLASAGAGKTGSVVHFIADKINNKIKPSEIISFSFTRKASNELRERTEKHYKGNKKFPYISTIHSFCWNNIIKVQYKEIGYTNIPTIIFDIPDEFNEKDHKEFGRKKDKREYINRIRDVINEDLQREEMTRQETIRLLSYLIDNDLIMFDYMIHMVNFLIENNIDFFTDTFKKIKYIMVDEAQDLNKAQYHFVKLLKSTFTFDDSEVRIVMVGDFKQSIYGFRGSDPSIIKDFSTTFNAETCFLSFNFRSAKEIVNFSNEIAKTIDLGNDELNKSQNQLVARDDLEGDIVQIYDVEEFLEEIQLLENPLHEYCILARTNQTVKTLGKILGLLEIPYYMHTEFDILKRVEVKVFMNLLNLSTNGYNKAIMVETIKIIKGGVPIRVARMIPKISSMKEMNTFSDLKGMNEMLQAYRHLDNADFDPAIKILSELLSTSTKTPEQIAYSLKRFLRDLNEVKMRENLDTWMEALDELLFEAQFLTEKQSGKVQLMTVHKAKGLQWRSVMFIYDFSLLEQLEHDFYDLEEEKRVVYTAITRPEENLVIWDVDPDLGRQLFSSGKDGNRFEKFIKNAIQRKTLDLDKFKKWQKID